MNAPLGPLGYMFKSNGFEYKTTTDGWEVTYERTIANEFELNGHPKVKIYKEVITYKDLPRHSVKEFVEGYVRCYAIQKGWI